MSVQGSGWATFDRRKWHTHITASEIRVVATPTCDSSVCPAFCASLVQTLARDPIKCGRLAEMGSLCPEHAAVFGGQE